MPDVIETIQIIDKGTVEKIPLGFFFGDELVNGETVSGTPSITIIVAARSVAKDTNPTAILNGAAAPDSTLMYVVVPIQAGVNGCTYRISVTSPTTNPTKSLTRVCHLIVADPA